MCCSELRRGRPPRNRENFSYRRRGQRVTRSVLAGSKRPGVASAHSTRQAPRVLGEAVREVPAEEAEDGIDHGGDRPLQHLVADVPAELRGVERARRRAPRAPEERDVVEHALVPACVLTDHLVLRLRQVHQLQQRQRRHQQAARAERVAERGIFRRAGGREAAEGLEQVEAHQLVVAEAALRAAEESTLGYALGARGLLMAPLPLLELVDLPETKDKMVRQNARWYKGVLDDVAFLWRAWRGAPTAFNAAQLCRHIGNKVLEWPIAAVVYPVLGFLGWHLAYRFAEHPVLFALGIAFPSISLGLTIWVGGIVTQDLIESLARYFPRAVDVRRTTLGQKFVGTFRCQTYWLLATRGAWRVLWALATTGRFDPAKTDRVTR